MNKFIRSKGPYYMVFANQASSVTLCYDPTMKAGVKIQRKANIRKIKLKIYKEQSFEKKKYYIPKCL